MVCMFTSCLLSTGLIGCSPMRSGRCVCKQSWLESQDLSSRPECVEGSALQILRHLGTLQLHSTKTRSVARLAKVAAVA